MDDDVRRPSSNFVRTFGPLEHLCLAQRFLSNETEKRDKEHLSKTGRLSRDKAKQEDLEEKDRDRLVSGLVDTSIKIKY